jgi:single-strand DNA-binding protein
MAGSLNKVQIIGNLGRDAELKYTQGGLAVLSCSVAATDQWTDSSGQRQSHTEWFRVQMWEKLAENLAPYLVKGKQVYIEGRLRTHKYTDKAGVERFSTEVRAERCVLLGSKAKENGQPEAVAAGGGGGDDDDVPF